MQPLPIDTLLPEIIESLRDAPNLLIEAAPGAGKTTRVPPALLDAGLAGDGGVWVLEPRRLAARLSARRVAEERGTEVGAEVGYQVRFEDVSGAGTRLRFVTEGVLTRRLLRDPQLRGIGAVVLDEFHERHLQTDVALALLRRLQLTRRPDLKIVVMSATLEAKFVSRFLGDCKALRSEGRRFDVRIEHLAHENSRPLAQQIEAAVRTLLADKLDGDVLAFLPGAREIRAAQEACARLASEADLILLPLHGELPPAEQDRAVRRAEKRKIILSTNVAETSVTIDGVVAVIDSGLARVAGHSPWSGLPSLKVERISRASATQRAGRAGRTRAGRALRLYTAHDLSLRPEHTAPEIARLDLAETALELHAAGVDDLKGFAWFEPPPPDALDAAESLLKRLGAIDGRGGVTDLGKSMLCLPIHPRLARIAVEASSRGVARRGFTIAALLSERDIRAGRVSFGDRGQTNREGADKERARASNAHGTSDVLELLDRFDEASRANFEPERLRRMNLDARVVATVERVRQQLERSFARDAARKRDGAAAHKVEDKSDAVGVADTEEKLLISILAGFPDRVARRRATQVGEHEKAGAELSMSNGGAATLAGESVVRAAEFLVAVEAGEREERGRSGGRAVVRSASMIDSSWLLDLFADCVHETSEVEWNSAEERVETLRRLMYDKLVLDENRRSETSEAASRLLAEKALAAGRVVLGDAPEIDRFIARVRFASRAAPEANLPELGEEDLRASLERLCEGLSSFAELREAVRRNRLLDDLRRRLDAEQARQLSALAPERVTLRHGREVKVNYESDQTPWIASRLQDFFGMNDAPKIARGRVPLVLHLLAPNNRFVQITIDLAGFWSRHYPQVRRELSRRYPRHSWAENPLEPATQTRQDDEPRRKVKSR